MERSILFRLPGLPGLLRLVGLLGLLGLLRLVGLVGLVRSWRRSATGLALVGSISGMVGR